MHDPADSADTSRTALRAALVDYAQSPGKYQVGLRQPQPLFAALPEVLQIAVGREGEGAPGEQESASLRDAARFFVRTGLLYPGADHYALLGLDRKAEPADLKNRYRLMMRLLHPDFSGPAAGAWSADSAVRVNRAYDTLSSAVERRAYDATLASVNGSAAVHSAAGRPRPSPKAVDSATRQSSFKTLAAVCAFAGVALVAVSMFGSGSSETGQLVQRRRVQPEIVQVAVQEVAPTAPAQAPKLPAVPAPTKTVVVAPPAKPPVTQLATRSQPAAPSPPAASAALLERAMQITRANQSPALMPSPTFEPKADVAVAVVPVALPVPPQPMPVSAPAPQGPVAAAPRPAPKPGPTLMEAQPLLSQLLQVMESGRGERILNLLDPDARSKPSAQALSRQYDSLVDGAKPVRVSHVEFKAEPGDGRLLVVGYLRLLAGEQSIGSLGKKMVLRAEFVSREGNVVITGLSGGPVN